ncbi:PA2169 family four-helix-bundle protein [Mucilaginibacter sp. UR6-1]|uniref:PA2169 family four-helix-bundle protein n=1 Tax=Mucilaginibacter sp. UR6-1 TaxID=1435643 RepID=UPI001E384645|nr:PA2169 family four-helix-bundle protein [Mucilaginibacter sp. UR6-1]MCC8411238.1 PA2169 family four-helix-bundle protein [Mucilaginibacter sp. UR6-1]
MATIEKSVEILNDLIQINNDRIEGFERASKELSADDLDLRNLFTLFTKDSRTHVQELTAAVALLGDKPETGNTITGTLHRTWLDVKATFTGQNRKSILQECERGEDAIKKAYTEALAGNVLPADVSEILVQQQQKINEGHDKIKALRDSAV